MDIRVYMWGSYTYNNTPTIDKIINGTCSYNDAFVERVDIKELKRILTRYNDFEDENYIVSRSFRIYKNKKGGAKVVFWGSSAYIPELPCSSAWYYWIGYAELNRKQLLKLLKLLKKEEIEEINNK